MEKILAKDFKSLKAIDNKGNVTTLDMPESSNVLQKQYSLNLHMQTNPFLGYC